MKIEIGNYTATEANSGTFVGYRINGPGLDSKYGILMEIEQYAARLICEALDRAYQAGYKERGKKICDALGLYVDAWGKTHVNGEHGR